jgi:hypothetical protein
VEYFTKRKGNCCAIILNEYKKKNRGEIPCFLFLRFPRMSAVLADTHAFVLGLQLLLLGGKNRNDQSRKGKAKPPNRNPPPTNQQPPEYSVMLPF